METIVFVPGRAYFEEASGDQLAIVLSATDDGRDVGPFLLTQEETNAVLNVVVGIARRESSDDSLPSYEEFVAGAPFPSQV